MYGVINSIKCIDYIVGDSKNSLANRSRTGEQKRRVKILNWFRFPNDVE